MAVETISDFETTSNAGTPLEGTQLPAKSVDTSKEAAPPSHEAITIDEPEGDSKRDSRGKFRHRAQSQQAGPEDVAAIGELTKRLRTAEQAAGIEKKPGESNRVYELRMRAELAEQLAERKKPQPVAPPPAMPQRRAVQPSQFNEPEPRFEQFAQASDPYLAHARALAAYDRKKENFDASQTFQQQISVAEQKQHDEKFNTWLKERQTEHDTRLGQFIASTPDAKQVMESAANLSLTPVMYASIELHGDGPRFMYTLAKSPDLADELFLLTEGKPVGDPLTNPLVAIVQRRLLQRVQAANTGSAVAPRQSTVAPRPPNPVRTAPQTPSEKLPSDDDSLEAHEAAFGRNRRRR